MEFNNIKAQTESSKYSFLYNDFDWLNENGKDEFTIQSLVVSASFFNIENELKILNDLSNEYKDLGFELLVQRDIDKERVDLEIVSNYLNLEDKTNFFPPIVVALIPKYHNIKGVSYESAINSNESNLNLNIANSGIIESFSHKLKDKSLRDKELYDYFFGSNELKYGSFHWDMEKFNAIVIDGQHRFYALKKFFELNPNLEKSSCFFPINFVIVTPNIGISLGADQYIKTAREFFIDINKNAKQVSHTRQILLDDLDLLRYLTRTSIKQHNLISEEHFFTWKTIKGKKSLEKIPQALINWNTDISERDKDTVRLLQLAQVTSTSLLYKILKDFILRPNGKEEKSNIFQTMFRVFEFNEYAPHASTADEEMFKRIQLKKELFEQKIKEIDEEEKSIEIEGAVDSEYFDTEYYNRKRVVLNDKALTFDIGSNKWLSDYFYRESIFGIALTMFYTRFTPYQAIIERIEKYFNDDKFKDIVNFLIDPLHKKKSMYLAQIKKDDISADFSILYDDLEMLKKDSIDTRYTVFQRAVFSDFDKVIDLLEIVLPKEGITERIAKYVDSLSDLYSKGMFNKELTVSLNEPLFLKSVREFSIDQFKVWSNIWIVDGSNVIKYRDADAYKIGHLIKVFALASLTKKNLAELRKDYGNRIINPLRSIIASYKALFLKRFKLQFELNNLTEAKSKIIDEGLFEADLEKIIDTVIQRIIVT